MKKLYLDMDGVVFDTYGTLGEIKQYLKNHKDTLEIAEEDISDAAWVYLYSNYDKVKTMPYFSDVLDLLRDNYDITFVSMYVSDEECAYKEYFSKMLDLPIILLDSKLYKDKSSVDMSEGFFVDDTPEYLETSNASHKLLMAKGLAYFFGILKSKSKYPVVKDWVELGMRLGVLDGKE